MHTHGHTCTEAHTGLSNHLTTRNLLCLCYDFVEQPTTQRGETSWNQRPLRRRISQAKHVRFEFYRRRQIALQSAEASFLFPSISLTFECLMDKKEYSELMMFTWFPRRTLEAPADKKNCGISLLLISNGVGQLSDTPWELTVMSLTLSLAEFPSHICTKI